MQPQQLKWYSALQN